MTRSGIEFRSLRPLGNILLIIYTYIYMYVCMYVCGGCVWKYVWGWMWGCVREGACVGVHVGGCGGRFRGGV